MGKGGTNPQTCPEKPCDPSQGILTHRTRQSLQRRLGPCGQVPGIKVGDKLMALLPKGELPQPGAHLDRCRRQRRFGGFLQSQGWAWHWGCYRGGSVSQWSDKPAKNLFSCLQAAGFVFASLTYPVHKQPSYSFLKIDLKLIHVKKTKNDLRTSLPFQWFRVCAFNAGGTALIPAWGSHMLCRREEVNIVFDENKKIIIIKKISLSSNFTTTRIAIIRRKKQKTSGGVETLIHCRWEYKMVQLLWKTIWWFPKK